MFRMLTMHHQDIWNMLVLKLHVYTVQTCEVSSLAYATVHKSRGIYVHKSRNMYANSHTKILTSVLDLISLEI